MLKDLSKSLGGMDEMPDPEPTPPPKKYSFPKT
jgi:hypothetical protein